MMNYMQLLLILHLLTGSSYDYPNLNVDYSDWKNHTFFGSSKRKLSNFRDKVKELQNYYTDISSSLQYSASIDSDLASVQDYRKDLFDQIQVEFDKFTP